jgi:NADH:ubiquinone oxidoreductase subunit F (NADH-binding)
MIIGAYAIGAEEGYIYVRAEYPLACEHLGIAIRQAEEYGFLGEGILGTDFSFRVHIKQGAGAFVCGEESALIASIEGRPGEPNPRPPYPAEKGLWNKPTNINNVKTWASVPHILKKGAEWFSSIGTENSKGTMIFSLVGKVNNTGLVEIPMGMTLKDMVYEIGGGIPGGKELKAVQTGGPSGGCIPRRLATIPVDYEELTKVGSMMGSGGCVVMDEDTCMVDVAKYFLSFTMTESCGKCTPCREGNARLLDVLTQICEGNGNESDIELLEELSETIIDGSLCALGKTAPNPVLTTIRYFKDEYIAHIKEKKCPAKVCRALIRYTIIPEKCTGCLACLKKCPTSAIIGKKREIHTIIQEKCTKCGTCFEVCRFAAVLVE